MKKLIIALILFATPMISMGSSSAHLDSAGVDLGDKESLQRGFKYFVNYCLSCHSAKYQRFERTANDLGLTVEDVKQNLMFTTGKIGSTMDIALNAEEATGYFGVTPPDLSVITRARGSDYIYTYLRSFYLDDSKPTGVNNVVFPDVGMPHVLWELQGWQEARFKKDEHGHMHFEKFELVKPGSMSTEEFDGAMHDLVNFMTYLGDPSQMERRALGVKVIIFLLVLFVLSYLLKKEYWKDIH